MQIQNPVKPLSQRVFQRTHHIWKIQNYSYLHRNWWREKDSNFRRLSSADLQSAAIDRSAIPPTKQPDRKLKIIECQLNSDEINISQAKARNLRDKAYWYYQKLKVYLQWQNESATKSNGFDL